LRRVPRSSSSIRASFGSAPIRATCRSPTDKGEGFENKIAALFADKLGKGLSFTWYPQAPGFVRNTLGAHRCDVVMGAPQGDDLVQVTNPYYRTAYALVFKKGSGLDGADTLSDPRLKEKRIGIVAGTPPGNNMIANGLMAKARPYPLVIDTRVSSSAADMMHDLASGEIDAGVLWGRWPATTRGRQDRRSRSRRCSRRRRVRG